MKPILSWISFNPPAIGGFMPLKQEIIIPGNKEAIKEIPQAKTYRSKERESEDRNFLPVIVKRIDEATRHPDDVLEKAIHEGIEQHKRSKLSLLLSSVSAGLILGFAAMSVSMAAQIFNGPENMIFNRIAMAVVYPLGFIICVMSGTQLFTEHTATAVYPVLDRRENIKSLMKLWVIVLFGNFLGTFLSSYMIASADQVILAKEGFIEVAKHLMSFSFGETVVSAILAGWLMAQGGWLILATPPASSQILCIYIVTFIIGLGGLHHSIAGSAEIFGGVFLSDELNLLDGMKTIGASVVGNLLGGSIFVAILNYAHIRKAQL